MHGEKKKIEPPCKEITELNFLPNGRKWLGTANDISKRNLTI